MTHGHHWRRSGPYDRGTYPVTVSQAQAAAGTVLHTGKMRLKGWSLVSSGIGTLRHEGEVTSPAAGATITQITGVPPGDYLASWVVELAGTLAAADQDNFNLVNGGSTVLQSVNEPVAGDYEQLQVVITVPGTGTIKVTANNLATVGAEYSAQLTLEPLAQGAIGNVLDAAQLVGVVSTGADQLDTEWFGDEGVYVGTSIAVQVTSGNLSGVLYVRDDPVGGEEDEPSQPSSASPRPPSPQAHH